MVRRRLAALALVATAAAPVSASAAGPAWSPTQAFGPTDATSVAARPGLLLAGGRPVTKDAFGGGTVTIPGIRTPGLFRSEDGGRTWALGQERILLPDGEVELRPITATPSRLAVPEAGDDAYAVFGTAAWWSEDDGRTWAHTGDVGEDASVLAVLGDGRLVAGLSAGGLRVSGDRGATWAPLGSGLPTARVHQVEEVDGALLVATEQGLYRSAETGAVFTRIGLGLPSPDTPAWGIVAVRAEVVASPTLFLARPAHPAAGTAFFSSRDLGETWTALPPVLGVPVPRLNPGALAAAIVDPNAFGGRSVSLYAGTAGGLHVSSLEAWVSLGSGGSGASAPGLTWLRIDPAPGMSGVRALAVADRDPGPTRADVVFATVFRAGLYRDEPHGDESGLTAPGWFDETDRGRTCLGLVARPDGSLFSACGRHVVRSDDAGATWTDTGAPRYDDPLGGAYFPLVASADGSLWTSGFDDGLYRSDPEVTVWRSVPFPGGSVGAVAAHPVDPDVVFAAGLTTNGCCTTILRRSTDGGLTWLPVLETGDNIYAIAVSPHDGRHVLVAAYDAGGWWSADGGATWTKVGLPSSPSSTSSVSFSLAQPGLAYAAGDGDLYRSTDFGATWGRVGVSPSFPLPSPWDPDTLYATSPTSGVSVTRDAGVTWEPLGDGLPGQAAGAIAADPGDRGRLYVAAGVLSSLSAGPPSYWIYRLDGEA